MKKKGVIILLCAGALSYVFGSTEERVYTEEDLLGLAHKPLRVVDQVELNDADAILAASLGEIVSTNVYGISLAGTDFTTAAKREKTEALVRYMRDKPLPRLRTINLNRCTGVKAFLTGVFDGTEKKFYSLMRIDLSNSDATAGDIQLIINHLKQYDKLVRDMSMYSERSRSNVIQVHIVVDRLLLRQLTETVIPTEKKPFVYYRAGGTKHEFTLYQIKVESDEQ